MQIRGLIHASHPVLKLTILKNVQLHFFVVILIPMGILYLDNFLSCSQGSLSVDLIRVIPQLRKEHPHFGCFLCLFTFILLFSLAEKTLSERTLQQILHLSFNAISIILKHYSHLHFDLLPKSQNS